MKLHSGAKERHLGRIIKIVECLNNIPYLLF